MTCTNIRYKNNYGQYIITTWLQLNPWKMMSVNSISIYNSAYTSQLNKQQWINHINQNIYRAAFWIRGCT